MDGVHVVHECLHSLVYAAYSHIDGMLFQPLVALYSYQIALDVIVDRSIFQMVEVNAFERGEFVDFLLVGLPYVRSQIEVECRNRLTAMHFILDSLH